MRVKQLLFVFLSVASLKLFANVEPRVPDDLYNFPDKLVKVSSVLYDISSKKHVEISGVGTVVALDPSVQQAERRYFILSVGHVALGKNLKIQTLNGNLWVVKQIFRFDRADLVLIELNWQEASPPPTMAYYLPPRLGNPGVLYTGFNRIHGAALRSEAGMESVLSPASSKEEFPCFAIDGVENSVLSGRAGGAQLLQAPWLPVPRTRLRFGEGKRGITRDLRAEKLESEFRIPRGYSGSPAVTPRGGGGLESPIYIISGILTASGKEIGPSTSLAGPQQIENLMDLALHTNRSAPSESDLRWVLFDGFFVRIAENVSSFDLSGPVGKGVVINN
jgi:hypothetical protein